MSQILALQQLDVEQEDASWYPCFSIHASLITNYTTTTTM
ncbi:hypothetical protein ABH941_007918 [Streptacidiphilus sp. EB103A]